MRDQTSVGPRRLAGQRVNHEAAILRQVRRAHHATATAIEDARGHHRRRFAASIPAIARSPETLPAILPPATVVPLFMGWAYLQHR